MAKIDPKSIGYLDETADDYCHGLDKASNWSDLRQHIELYSTVFPDADEQARKNLSNNDDFEHFKLGLKMERKGKFAGEEWAEKFGNILLPAIMIHVGGIASTFKVPFGLAFCRAREVGGLKIENGIAVWQSTSYAQSAKK